MAAYNSLTAEQKRGEASWIDLALIEIDNL